MIISTLRYPSLIAFLLLLCIQCRNTQAKKTAQKEYKLVYIDQFKLTYLRKVLRVGFNQSEAIQNSY